MSVCAFGASSQHLRVLTEAGLLVERCEGTRRLYRVFVGNNPLQLGRSASRKYRCWNKGNSLQSPCDRWVRFTMLWLDGRGA
jgi:DNA-binding transcriptional ArsR family regulator